MSAVLEWLKTFLMLYFFLTLILYLVPKKSYQKYLEKIQHQKGFQPL